jgi:DNA-binding MarR family transcriptional regulator
MIPEPYNIEESLGYLTGRLASLILKRNVQSFSGNGLVITSDQWIFLVHVWSHDGISQQAISDLMHKDKSATTRLISSLEAKDLAYRSPGPSDGREKFVYLTDKGKKAMKRATELVQDVLEKSYAGIEADDMNRCKTVLRKAYLNLL